jgi:aminobenzoyl-glutamate transport protein
VLTEVTNDAIHLVDPNRSIRLTSNLYFGVGSTILLSVLGAFVTARIIERRLGRYDPAAAGEAEEAAEEVEVSPEAEARGLRFALWGLLGVVAVIALLTRSQGRRSATPRPGA